MLHSLEFSVVVPVHNEAGNVEKLISEIAAALDGRAYEMVFVDDASTDDTRAILAELKARFPALRVLGHRKNAGQSRAIRSGILAARAPVVGTLDGDGQNDPADLPDLYRMLTRPDAPEKLKMVMGRRGKRKDSAWKKFGSRFANAIRRRMLRDDCDDSGCGIKVMDREAFISLPYFDHIHRYMPAMMRAEGYDIEFKDVNHRQREEGRSKYTNFGRLWAALSDLRGVMWLIRRRRNPEAARRDLAGRSIIMSATSHPFDSERQHWKDIRVYYEDTDFTGMVYHANYLRFFERGRSDFLRDAGVSHQDLLDRPDPAAFTLVRAEVDFKRAAKVDDLLTDRNTICGRKRPAYDVSADVLARR